MAALAYNCEWFFIPNIPGGNTPYEDINLGNYKRYIIEQDSNVVTMPSVSDFSINEQALFAYDGHTVVEWNDSPDGSGDTYIPGESYSTIEQGQTFFYAIWGSDSKAHTITITTGSATKSYDRLPLTSATISINGLPDGSTITARATGTITAPGAAENTYSIDWGTDNPDDYVIVENLGTLTVTPAVMTVTAGNVTKVYGEADPEFTYTVSGLLSGDTAEAFLITLSRETGEDVGSYAIVPAVRLPSGFYEPVCVNGTLEITRLPVTVTVDGYVKIEGEEDPDFTVTIVPASIPLSSIEFEITREPGETQGEYIVTPTGEAEQGNYLVTFVPGTLIIAYDRKPEELPYVSVKIPDELLRDAGTLTAYLTYSDAEAGEYRTIKIVNLEIMPRMKRPEEEDDPSPSTDIYTQLRTIEEKIAGLYDQLAKIRMRL